MLGDNGLDHEEHLAEADGVLEDRDQILVLLGHVADLLAQLLLYADEVAQLRLQAVHLHVLQLLVLLIKVVLHLSQVLHALLVGLRGRVV